MLSPGVLRLSSIAGVSFVWGFPDERRSKAAQSIPRVPDVLENASKTGFWTHGTGCGGHLRLS